MGAAIGIFGLCMLGLVVLGVAAGIVAAVAKRTFKYFGG